MFPYNIMPANAAAWYMAKRKFYANQPQDNQLLPFTLKKYPEKFRVQGMQVRSFCLSHWFTFYGQWKK